MRRAGTSSVPDSLGIAFALLPSMSNMEIARQVSPTLERRRTRSSFKAIETRQRMALSSSTQVATRSASSAKAEPFFDELLTVDADPGFRRLLWVALALGGATIAAGLLILAALPH